MDVVDIVLCGDRRVLPGMAVSVRSALECATVRLNVYVIGVGFEEEDRAALRRSWRHGNCGSVQFADLLTSKLGSFRSTAYLKSKATYARYFIAQLFPQLGRCVYLDSDLMVLRDLAETRQFELGTRMAAAVRDISIRTQGANPQLRSRLGLHDERDYFNNGFLVLDLDAWRRDNLTEKLIQLSVDRFDDLHSQDQDALNIALEGRVLLLDPVWNTSQYEQPNPLKGHVVHLMGPIKPWHARYTSEVFGFGAYYREVVYRSFADLLARTDFGAWKPWNPFGLGKYAESVMRYMPTADMVLGKLRRAAGRAKRATAARGAVPGRG